MAVEIANRLDRIGLALDLHLVGLHDLLARLPDVTQPHVNPRRLHARARRVLDRLRKSIELRVEVDRPRRVDNAAVDVSAEVDLAHVTVLQHRLVARVGGPVRGDVVDGAAGGEGNPRLEAVLLHERTAEGASVTKEEQVRKGRRCGRCRCGQITHLHEGTIEVLQLLADVGHEHARLDDTLHVLAHLSVALGRRAHLVVRNIMQPLELTLLRIGDARAVVALVLDLHAVGHVARRELLEHGHRQPPLAAVLLRLTARFRCRVRTPFADAAQQRTPLRRCRKDWHRLFAAVLGGRRRLLARRRPLLRLALFLRRAVAAALAIVTIRIGISIGR